MGVIDSSSPTSLGSIFSNPLNDVLAGLGGAAGAFPTPTNSTTTTNQNSNTTQSGTSSPVLSAENQALLNQLGDKYSHLVSTGVNLQPYQEQQEQQINTNSGIASRAAQEALAARGLANSPVSGTVAANQEGGRIGQITNLQQSIPLLSNQLNLQNLGATAGFTSSIPHGTSTTGTSDTTSSGTSTTKQNSGGGIGGFLGGLGSTIGGIAGLAALSDKRLKDGAVDSIDGLEKVLKMKGKQFTYKDDPTGEVHSGFMADDIEKLFPETVTQHPSGYKMLKYHELLPKVVKAIQDLHSKVEEVSKNSKSTVQPKAA